MYLHERAKRLVEHIKFERFIIFVISLNAIVVGLETVPSAMAVGDRAIKIIDSVALTIFVIELLLKLYVYRIDFFRNGWRIFDFAIVTSALIPGGNQFSVLRALRILRALRLMSSLPSMRNVITALFKAVPGMATVIFMLALLFYVFAVMATNLFGQVFPDWFGHLGLSLFSLFQIMTLESWSMGIVRPVMDVYPYAWAFFVPFILLTSFIVLNLFIGAIVSAMGEDSQGKVDEKIDEIVSQLKCLREDVAALKVDLADR